MFDLQLFSLNISNKQERPDLPGALAFTPPKRTARGRNLDILNIYIEFSGPDADSHEWQSSMLKNFASAFYASSGSVTTSIRSAVEHLNNLLLQRNLKIGQGASQITATLNLAVVRDETIIIAHAGATKSIYVTDSGVEVFSDETQIRPLGVSKATQVTFFQPTAQPNSLLIFCQNPPVIWDDPVLAGIHSLSLESLKRRLLNQAGSSIRAQFTRIVAGKGMIFRRKLQESNPEKAQSGTNNENQKQPVPDESHAILKAQIVQESLPLKIEDAAPENKIGETELHPEQAFAASAMQNPLEQENSSPAVIIAKTSPIKKHITKAWLFGRKFKQDIDKKTGAVAAKVAPGLKNRRVMSPSLMLFIAIAIPLVIVAIATTVYLEKGKNQNHQYYLGEAEKTIAFALNTEDLGAKITYWEAALSFVDQAETFGVTNESESLRNSIQQNLDMLGGMSHLSLIPILEEDLDPSINITKVVSSLSDSSNLYLFDSGNNQVLHLIRESATSYQLDDSFNCSSVSNPNLSNLVDVVILPPNAVEMSADSPSGASVMAVDEIGNLLYCSPGKIPAEISLPAPSVGWGQIKSIALDGGNLYVLDALNNRVWIFIGSNYTFPEAPVPFFAEFVPANMQTMKQLAINLDELFLLNENSLVTKCRYSDLTDYVSTKCDDPATLYDLRTSSTPIPFVLGTAHFISMLKMDIPSSSLYFLDSTTGDLYKFGIQLNLYHVFSFRVDSNYSQPVNPITGFGITAEQMIILAYGNQLYATTLN